VSESRESSVEESSSKGRRSLPVPVRTGRRDAAN
jgi:hypothetical protein